MVLKGVFTLGTLVAFKSYLDRFTTSLSVLTQLWVEAQKSIACLERIYWLLTHPDELKRGGIQPKRLKGQIEFRNVFIFSGERKILKDFSMKINENEFVALVGRNGSGKSTVVNLLLKHVSPDKGEILLDQNPLSEYDTVSLRRRLGIVSDFQFFFFDTIRDNLKFVKTDAKNEELLNVLEKVGLGEWVRRPPHGLDTWIGERGLRLSSGERQHLAIARVLLQNPDIIIFDEATSTVDNLAERDLYSLLTTQFRSRKTIIVIAHRFAGIQSADRIYVLDQGRVVEEGTHFELLNKQDGVYRKFWE